MRVNVEALMLIAYSVNSPLIMTYHQFEYHHLTVNLIFIYCKGRIHRLNYFVYNSLCRSLLGNVELNPDKFSAVCAR
jgi:hypothetical protein